MVVYEHTRVFRELLGQFIKRTLRKFDDPIAFRADYGVLVSFGRDCITVAAILEVHLRDEVELDERLKRSVHRRKPRVRKDLLYFLVQLVYRHVGAAFLKNFKYR